MAAVARYAARNTCHRGTEFIKRDPRQVLVGGAILLTKRLVAQKKDVAAFKEKHGLNEDSVRSKFRHVTPLALINIGIISTASELTSALPYFAFLGLP